jgi:hypothetical protein
MLTNFSVERKKEENQEKIKQNKGWGGKHHINFVFGGFGLDKYLL